MPSAASRPAVALAIGGSILAPAQPDPDVVQDMARTLAALAQERRVLVSVGGGAPARTAIALARRSGCTEDELDRIGIAATRLNAQTLLAVLKAQGAPCNDEPPHAVADAARLADGLPLVVMGGTTPGHSTDFVAASLAAAVGAERLVIATNVDGVYDRDPRKHADAQRIEDLGFERLLAIVGDTGWSQAGAPGVVDGPASLLVAREGIETCVVQGSDMSNLRAACAGRPFHGSRVHGQRVTA